MLIKDYLTKEEIPDWILNYQKERLLSPKEIFSSNTLYYAGADIDGIPLSVFNKTHAVHTFIYVDYGENASQRIEELKQDNVFRGYHLIDIRSLKCSEILNPRAVHTHIRYTEQDIKGIKEFGIDIENKFAFVAVFERDDELDDSHGAKRFALIYIGDDAIAAYDRIYVCNHKVPLVFVLKDHGYGKNYDHFGKGGKLEDLMTRSNCFPEYVYTNNIENIWCCYSKIDKLSPEAHMHLCGLVK